MIRLDKSAAARLGFGGANADRHTADRLYKKTQTKSRSLEQKAKPEHKRTAAKSKEGEALPLIKISDSRYIVDLERAYDTE